MAVRRNLALWLAADGPVELDDEGRVIAWNDIPAGDNQTDEIAWQPEPDQRPLRAEDAIGGKPAIRFSRDQDHLVTTPLATANDQTVFIVFSQHARADDKDNSSVRQLLNYNGPPVRYLKDLRDPGVLQFGDEFEPGRFHGFVFSVVSGSRFRSEPLRMGIHTGQVEANKALPLRQPAVLAYVYSHQDNYSALYMDDELQSTADAQLDIAINSRKMIGKHGKPGYQSFQGDIAEVVIFNDRLSEKEISKVNRHMIKKYKL